MNTKNYILVVLLLIFGDLLMYSQTKPSGALEIKPYAGISSPTSDFKEFSENGSVFGVSIDKYFDGRFGLGLDFNFQTNEFLNPFDFSGIVSPNNVLNFNTENWSSFVLTLGPAYRIVGSKFNVEIYSKFGLLYIKSPEATSTYQYINGSKDVFSLPEQERSAFGITSGVRINYKISKSLSLFLNPQYVYSSAELQYCNCGLDNLTNVEEVIAQIPITEKISPSYLNINAGLTFNLGGKEKNNVNRNLSMCQLTFVKTVCEGNDISIQFNQFWSNYPTNFTKTVEVYNGSTLLNTPTPTPLSLNMGNDLFQLPINSNLIGSNLTAVLKIFDTNGNQVRSSPISFTVSQCAPQPPSCSFDLDITNATCDNTNISYNTTGSWANIVPGSIIDIVAQDQAGNPINFNLSPNPFPISITATNTSGSLSNTVLQLPNTYNGTPISVMLKISQPTTGYEKLCGFADFFTPLCEPETIFCDWEYTITCDKINKGIKIDVSSLWTNAPVGSQLRYSLINLNGGANIPFTAVPGNLPLNIVTNGSSIHTLLINSSYSSAQAVFKMEILDANGIVICSKGSDVKLPSCIYETCEFTDIDARCDNEQPSMSFNFNWSNFNNFSNYTASLSAVDESGQPVAWFAPAFPPFVLTGNSGSVPISMNLMSQYAGQTITITSKICETGTNKDCTYCEIKIKIPVCCEICSDISIKDNTNLNQTNIRDFVVKGLITRPLGSSPINKAVAQLEYIYFESLNGLPLANITNFEFSRGWFLTQGSQNGNALQIGSTGNNRSNFMIKDFSPSTSNSILFRLNIDRFIINNNIDKRIKSYRIKITLYKDDGTYCEEYLNYRR